MEAVSSHSVVTVHGRSMPRGPRRFEQDTSTFWLAVIPVVMATTIAGVWWMHTLAHAR